MAPPRKRVRTASRRRKDQADAPVPPPPGTTFSDIPNEVLDIILRKLSNKDLDNAMKVNRRWFTYINEGMGIKVQVGQNKTPHQWRWGWNWRRHSTPVTTANDMKKVSVPFIAKFSVSTCWMQGEISPKQEPSFRTPLLLRKLMLDCTMGPNQFKVLVTPLAWLKEFALSQTTLLNLRLKDVGTEPLQLPQMTTFIISGNSINLPIATKNYTAEKWRHMVLNILFLLRRLTFPRLQEIVLQSLHVRSTKQEDVIMMQLINFLSRHKKSVRKLSILFHQPEDGVMINSSLTTPINVESLAPLLDNLKLESIFIRNCRSGPQTRRTQQLLSHALTHLAESRSAKDTVKHFTWSFRPRDLVRYNPGPFIENNSRSLASVELKLSPYLREINCTMFQNCSLLKFLKLKSGCRNWDDNPNPAADLPASLVNLNSLPLSIEEFSSAGFKIFKQESQRLSDLPHLSVLELIHAGSENNFGLALDTLSEMLAKKTVQVIHLRKSLNISSTTQNITFINVGMQAMRASLYGSDLCLKLVENQYKRCTFQVNPLPSDGYHFSSDRSKYFKNYATPIYFHSWSEYSMGHDFVEQITPIVPREPKPHVYFARAAAPPRYLAFQQENIDFPETDTEESDEEDEEEADSGTDVESDSDGDDSDAESSAAEDSEDENGSDEDSD